MQFIFNRITINVNLVFTNSVNVETDTIGQHVTAVSETEHHDPGVRNVVTCHRQRKCRLFGTHSYQVRSQNISVREDLFGVRG